MGNTKSQSAITNISEQITNVAMESVQDCQTTSTQKQNLDVNNSGFRLFGSYKVEQKTDVKSQCFSDVNRQSALQNNIVNAITQATTSSGQSVWPAFGNTKAKATANVKNIITNNVTMKNIQKTYNALRQKQSAKITNSGVVLFESVDMSQGASVFAAATLQEVANSGIFNQIQTNLDQTTTAKTQSPLEGLFAGLTTIAALFFLLIVVIILAVGWWVFSEPSSAPAPAVAAV